MIAVLLGLAGQACGLILIAAIFLIAFADLFGHRGRDRGWRL